MKLQYHLGLWFAGFLSRHLGDQARALEQLKKAEILAPTSAIVRLECARVLQYQREFDQAESRLRGIQDIDQLSSRTRRVHLDLLLQNEMRKAEFYCGQEAFLRSLECLEAAKRTFDEAPKALIDQRTVGKLSRVKRQIPALRRAFRSLPEEERLSVIEKWIEPPQFDIAVLDKLDPSQPQAALTPPNRGQLSQLKGSYGFIDTGGARIFFHRDGWTGSSDFTVLGEGAIVEFEVGTNDRGSFAHNVRPIDVGESEGPKSDRHLGAIKSLSSTFGFIKLDRGGEIFFHRSACTATTRFRGLRVGERVRCSIDSSERGRPHAHNVEAYSGL